VLWVSSWLKINPTQGHGFVWWIGSIDLMVNFEDFEGSSCCFNGPSYYVISDANSINSPANWNTAGMWETNKRCNGVQTIRWWVILHMWVRATSPGLGYL
jgi:hypothetical protein